MMTVLEILFWLGFGSMMVSFVVPSPVVGIILSAAGGVAALGSLFGQRHLRKRRQARFDKGFND